MGIVTHMFDIRESGNVFARYILRHEVFLATSLSRFFQKLIPDCAFQNIPMCELVAKFLRYFSVHEAKCVFLLIAEMNGATTWQREAAQKKAWKREKSSRKMNINPHSRHHRRVACSSVLNTIRRSSYGVEMNVYLSKIQHLVKDVVHNNLKRIKDEFIMIIITMIVHFGEMWYVAKVRREPLPKRARRKHPLIELKWSFLSPPEIFTHRITIYV